MTHSMKTTEAVAITKDSLSRLEKRLAKLLNKKEMKTIKAELALVQKAYTLLNYRLLTVEKVAAKPSETDLL